MPTPVRMSRRGALKLGAAAATLPLVHIRTAGAAGKLSLGIIDHWVIEANAVRRAQIQSWAEKNKVEVSIDFISSVGNQDLLTLAAESKSRQGHDIRSMSNWSVHQYQDQLVSLDDAMKRLIAKYGPVSSTCEYLAKAGNSWKAVPTPTMSKHMSSFARIDYFRDQCGLDLQAMYPARAERTPLAEQWDWDHFLGYAEKMKKFGKPFGLAVSNNADSVDWFGSLFAAYGAELVDAKGDIHVKSDPVRAAIEYAVRLAKFLPEGVYGWDGTSNNRAIISDQSAFIFDAPSSWSVALKDAPHVAENSWLFPNPKGPKGRFVPYNTQYLGVWDFSPNKSAASDLIEYLSEREQVEPATTAAKGYDIPPFLSMSDFPIWAEEGPPKGLLFNYPTIPTHDANPCIAGFPAPPDIAVQIYNNGLVPIMVGRIAQGGHSVNDTIAWAENELEGYSR
jgi:hypothetical protein